jgi:hypothetical protein
MDPRELSSWFAAAERAAGLEKLERGVWHAYRRKWAKERKHLPVKDVMVAGGWQDVRTFLESYNEPDEATMLAVMEEPDRRRAAETVELAGAGGPVVPRAGARPAESPRVRRRPQGQHGSTAPEVGRGGLRLLS